MQQAGSPVNTTCKRGAKPEGLTGQLHGPTIDAVTHWRRREYTICSWGIGTFGRRKWHL